MSKSKFTAAEYHDVRDPERAAVSDPKPKPPEAHGNAQASDGAGSFSETNARQSAPAEAQPGPARLETPENQVHAGGAGGSPAAQRCNHCGTILWSDGLCPDPNCANHWPESLLDRPAVAQHDGWIAFWVDPDDPVSWFANGLTMAIQADRVLATKEFARCWPVVMPLHPDELSKFCDWLLVFEDEYRAQHAARYQAEE